MDDALQTRSERLRRHYTNARIAKGQPSLRATRWLPASPLAVVCRLYGGRYWLMAWPRSRALRSCWSCSGGGSWVQACHQRCSSSHGVSQARTARSALGQLGYSAGVSAAGPPLCGAVERRFRRASRCSVVGGGWVEPGVPAERERAVDQGLVAADRGGGADLEVGPAEFVLDLF